jgi:hypothetical protein
MEPAHMSTVPVSGATAVAAYLPSVRFDSPDSPAFPVPRIPGATDSVQISDEARRLARESLPELHLFGEVRYDPPHTDDPDFPWEVAHRQWVDLMKKVFGSGDGAPAGDGPERT